MEINKMKTRNNPELLNILKEQGFKKKGIKQSGLTDKQLIEMFWGSD